MKRSENKMMEPIAPEEQNNIRDYLLGNLRDEAKMRQIEEKLMLNDDFEEQLSLAADDLIEDYLDGNLSEREHAQFLTFFLSLKENQENLQLTENLRKYASSVKKGKASATRKNLLSQLKSFSSSTWLRFAIGALVILGLIFGVWRICFYQSDVDKGLAQLRLAYRDSRPFESRITEFAYAPVNDRRGSKEISLETQLALRQAENLLINAASENRSAQAFQALGKYYLTEKNFDQADRYFEKAAALNSEDAELQSDWGATLLEQGKEARLNQDGAAQMKFIDQSLNHLDKAISLNPRLLEPRFNRALSLQILPAPEEAKQAWREYLDIDKNSEWSKEAGQYLQTFESRIVKDYSADELEQNFLKAVAQKDGETAWKLISLNRELIKGKYLPQRLAMSFLQVPDEEKEKFLYALEYAGNLEAGHIDDPFAKHLSNFYKNLPKDKIEPLTNAQGLVRDGYSLCLKLDYKAALEAFQAARELFLQAGDVHEAKLSEYFIGYSLINTGHSAEAIGKISGVVNFASEHNYKWLEVTALYWLAISYDLNHSRESKKTFEEALTKAKNIQDSYAIQRNMLELAGFGSFVGQQDVALNYLQRVLQESLSHPETSLRQSYRNYNDALSLLIDSSLYNAAKPIAGETIRLADLLEDQMFETQARNNAALLYAHIGDFDQARSWLKEGKAKADGIVNESSRNRLLADGYQQAGYMERMSGNYEASEQLYKQAAEIYEQLNVRPRIYITQKGRLLALQKLGKIDELERQIPIVLQMTEDYRDEILDEQARISFFDSEESIFDIAADYQFGRGNYEQAYNYAEASSSRSLLDWLQKGIKKNRDKAQEVLPADSAPPLDITEIRRRMPDNVQIVQYSVLENKVLIWLVSKENFTVKSVFVEAGDLRQKIEKYTTLLRQRDDESQTEAKNISREIYKLLIDPVASLLDSGKEICLIPSKQLFSLPFAALTSPSEKLMIEQFRILYAPSANIFLACTEIARQKASSENESLLSVGNPAFNHEEFKDLPDLPSAENEAREVADYYRDPTPQILLGADATKTALLGTLPKAEIIHFAGHYVVTPGAPSASYLLLAQNAAGATPSESILTNAELTGQTLPRAKLVILSACQTGAETSAGEGLIGLSRTFLAAGAPLVVASQWSVETKATEIMMNRFHHYRREGKMTTTEALRRAQLSMINNPYGQYRDPYYWAAFSVVGGYSTY